MAQLIKCRVCGGPVSSEAEPPCPHCKDPFITEERALQHQKEVEEGEELHAEYAAEERRREAEDKRREAVDKRRKELVDRNKCPDCGGALKDEFTQEWDRNKMKWVYTHYKRCKICGRMFS